MNTEKVQHPSATAEIKLVTDAIVATLVQKEEDYDKGWSPVAFYSKTLSPGRSAITAHTIGNSWLRCKESRNSPIS